MASNDDTVYSSYGKKYNDDLGWMCISSCQRRSSITIYILDSFMKFYLSSSIDLLFQTYVVQYHLNIGPSTILIDYMNIVLVRNIKE